jgi:hypothetical protein
MGFLTTFFDTMISALIVALASLVSGELVELTDAILNISQLSEFAG